MEKQETMELTIKRNEVAVCVESKMADDVSLTSSDYPTVQVY